MKTKRILSMLICICMLASTVLSTVPTFAETENVTENIEEISSYSIRNTAVSANTLIETVKQKKTVPDGYIGIFTAEDLDNVRNDLSANYILMADIDLSEYDNWLPIGTETIQTLSDGDTSIQYSKFSGIFDGNGYSIKNMSITANEKENVGLFAMIGSNIDGDRVGQLENILLENISISLETIKDLSYKIGGLVGSAYSGNIYNCAVTGEINITGNESAWLKVGGIIGYSLSQITYCKSAVDITYDHNMESSFGKILTYGGIVGTMYYNTDIINDIAVGNCISYSNIILNGGTGTVGGIIGEANSSFENIYQISENINFGKLEAITQYDCIVAGIIGEMSSAENSGIHIMKSQNCGSIYSSNEAAGICGRIITEDTAKSCSIEYCVNTGDITVCLEKNTKNYSVRAGGIVSNINLNSINRDDDSSDDSSSVFLISNCYNSGNINAISNYSDDSNWTFTCPIGGIVGSIFADTFEFEINSCYVSGEIFVENVDDVIDFQIGSLIGALESETYYCIDNCYVIDVLDFDVINYTDVANEYGFDCAILSDEEMQSDDSFVGFNFDSVWEIGKAEDYNYPTLINNPHRGIVVEPEIPEEPSEITSTWDTTDVTLNEGEEYSFIGSVSTTAENGLKDLQININSATDDTVGIKYYRAENIGTESFDLSVVPSSTVNAELSDEDQTIVLAPGTTWKVQLWATDTDGNSIGDAEIMILTIAEEEISDSIYWDGSIAKSFAGGTGTENDPYRIETAAQLVYFLKQIADGVTFENEYIILINDIVLNQGNLSYDLDSSMISYEKNNQIRYKKFGESQWYYDNSINEYICDDNYVSGLREIDFYDYYSIPQFNGYFDGLNNCIYGIILDKGCGLFGKSNGTITNLNIVNSIFSLSKSGSLVTDNQGLIDNCNVDAIVLSSSDLYSGGIVGRNYGIIKNTTFNGYIIDSNETSIDNVGGIAGQNYNEINNCINYSTIFADDKVGGITGYLYTYSKVSSPDSTLLDSCKNYGKIYGTKNVGGICGFGYNEAYNTDSILKIENSHNYGEISGTKNIAGILGYLDSDDKLALSYITNCSNQGDVSATENYVGGIIGYQDVSNNLRDDVLGVKVSKCFNTGDIIGNTYVGGLIGYSELWYWCTVILEDCYNSGNVSGDSYVAGIVSNVYSFWMAGIRFSNLYNIGSITSLDSNVGAIVCKFQNYGYTILENLYFNSLLNGIVETDIEDDSEVVNIRGYTDSELQNASSYIGFDFDTIWEIGVTDGYPYPTLRGNSHIKGTDEPSLPDEPEIPKEPSEITSTWDTTDVTLNEGEEYLFIGSVSTTAENGLKDLQININYATDDTVGIKYYRAENIGTESFDLSTVPALTVNAELSDEDQTIVLAPGTTWEVQLWATDTDGNSIGDAEIMILTIAEKEIETGRPTVDGLADSYEITLGESLTLEGIISAFGEGLLNKVTLQHNEECSTFEVQALNIALESATADLSEFTISADEYPLNTVGTYEFIIYASADNFTDTDNRIASFKITVNPVEEEEPDVPEISLAGNKYVQTTYKVLDLDYIPEDYAVSENPPYLDFIDEENGVFFIVYGEGFSYVDFTYTIEDGFVTLIPNSDGEHGMSKFGRAEKLVMQINEDETLSVYDYTPDTYGGGNYAIGSTAKTDVFEIKVEEEIESGRPTVEGLSESYEITLGESLTLEGTISAFGEGRLNKVTLQHNEKGSTFESQTQNIALESATADLSDFTISADEYPLNTVGIHEFIIYASADNFIETDNRIASFKITVNPVEEEEPTECQHKYIFLGEYIINSGKWEKVDSDYHVRTSVLGKHQCMLCGVTKIDYVSENPAYEPHSIYEKVVATYIEPLRETDSKYETEHQVKAKIHKYCSGCNYDEFDRYEVVVNNSHNFKTNIVDSNEFTQLPSTNELSQVYHLLKVNTVYKSCDCGVLISEDDIEYEKHSILNGSCSKCGYVSDFDEYKNQYINILKNLPDGSDPIENEQITSMIREYYYSHLGIEEDIVNRLMDEILEAERVYRDIFVYSLFEYELGTSVGVGIFKDTSTGYKQLYDKVVINAEHYNQQDVNAWFHEFGHAVDFNSDVIDKKELYIELEKDVKNNITESINNVILDYNKNALAIGKEIIGLTQKDIDLIISTIMNQNSGKTVVVRDDSKKITSIDVNVPNEIPNHLKDIYKNTVESLIKELYINGGTKSGNSSPDWAAYMLNDIHEGMTNGTIYSFQGHSTSGADYWFEDHIAFYGGPTYNQSNEAWAEFFSAKMMGNEDAIEQNNKYFSNGCQYMNDIAEKMRDYYIDKIKNS